MDLKELQKQTVSNAYQFVIDSIRSPDFERSELKDILKRELGEIGHWKNLPRGKPNNFKERK